MSILRSFFLIQMLIAISLVSCGGAEEDVVQQTESTESSLRESTESSLQPGMYLTKGGGYCACGTEEDLDKFIGYASKEDYTAMNALLNSNRCVQIQEGIRVSLESASMLSGKVEIRPEGQTASAWTVREALVIN